MRPAFSLQDALAHLLGGCGSGLHRMLFSDKRAPERCDLLTLLVGLTLLCAQLVPQPAGLFNPQIFSKLDYPDQAFFFSSRSAYLS